MEHEIALKGHQRGLLHRMQGHVPPVPAICGD